MNEGPPQVPPVERPQAPTDDTLEKLEENTLDKQAKSAAYRAVVEHNQHVLALNSRIDVLQAKLDKRENELHNVIPKVSELQQAKRTSRIGAAVETVGISGGATLLSIASFAPDGSVKYACFGAGISVSSLAVFAKVLFAVLGWPK